MQVMEQISALGNQIADLGPRLDHFSQVAGQTASHGDQTSRDLRHIHRILEELRPLQVPPKRASDSSLSPAQRANLHSPGRIHPKYDSSASRQSELSSHRESFHASSPAGSQYSEPDPGVMKRMAPPPLSRKPSTMHKEPEKEVLDERIKNFDPLNGQLSIPQNHTTAAHKLLTHWTAIKPFYEGLFDENYARHYVMLEERNRGVLRIFGRGEGHDTNTSKPRQYANSPSNYSEQDSNSVSSNSTDGYWGTGFDSISNAGPAGGPENFMGGLNQDGSLCLDATVIRRLRESFLANVWILHPFLDKDHIYHSTERFIRQYSPQARSEAQTYATSPGAVDVKPDVANLNKGYKRKRSNAGICEMDDHQPNHARSQSSASRVPIERSINNAVVLMILALGKICQQKDLKEPLPAPVSDQQMYVENAAPSPVTHAPSPVHAMKSPISSSTPRSAGTPGMQHERFAAHIVSRTSSQDSHGPLFRQGRGVIRNVDRLPGLAYYTYATNIIGETIGSPDLVHAHACLLAGLYQGQMARVMDSWRWINMACVDVKTLFIEPECVLL